MLAFLQRKTHSISDGRHRVRIPATKFPLLWNESRNPVADGTSIDRSRHTLDTNQPKQNELATNIRSEKVDTRVEQVSSHLCWFKNAEHEQKSSTIFVVFAQN